MGAESAIANELKIISKELHEINRKLDRLCKSYLFSIDPPIVMVNAAVESYKDEE